MKKVLLLVALIIGVLTVIVFQGTNRAQPIVKPYSVRDGNIFFEEKKMEVIHPYSFRTFGNEYAMDRFALYFQENKIFDLTKGNPLKKAGDILFNLAPTNDTFFDAVVLLHQEMTTYYGQYDVKDFYPEIDFSDYRKFWFENILLPEVPRDKLGLIGYLVFKYAFVDEKSELFFSDFDYPVAPITGGRIVNKIHKDDTVTVYAFLWIREHLGPAAVSCEQSMVEMYSYSFKKISDRWKLVSIDYLDSWETLNTQTCTSINQDKMEKYENMK